MKFLSDILAKAGLTVDGVVTLNNTATGQTPDANDNSTKLATTAWVRTFVQPYSLPIASATVLGGIKVGAGLSINSSTGVLSASAAGISTRDSVTLTATAGQTVFTTPYIPGQVDVFYNGSKLVSTEFTATNGTTITLAQAAVLGDLIEVVTYLASGGVNSNRTITINGVTYDLTANRTWSALPTGGTAGQLLAKVDSTDYNAQWVNEAPAASYTSQVKHQVKASQAITKGQAVYVSSADGTNMIVSLASNASEGTSSKTMGLLEESVSNNGITNVITEGLLAGLNTNGANAGDPVWLGTDGNLIYGLLNKPSAPAHLVFIGVVTRANANNGEIFVKVQNGFEMGELHDYVQSGVQNNYVISYESSTSLYKPKSIATLLGYTPVNAARTLTINGTAYDLTADRTWTLTTSVVAEGTNLYYTTARVNSDFDTRLATKSTTNLAEGTNLYYTDTRVGTYLTANSYATQTYVNTAVSNLVDAAPGTLDTLNELAAALGDDPNFATTVATSIGTKVPNTRTITINGTAYDLSTDRSWTINSMVYPGAGIAVSTGSAWGTSITNNSTNWNTAYGWGNHASAGYLTSITSSQVTTALGYTPLSGSGTTNYIPKWTGSTALGNSLIYDDGSGIGINTSSIHASSSFKLDVNGGVIIKNTSGTTAQLILIDSNPATGGNNGFVQLTAGGNTGTAFGQWQTFYGTSIASGTLRLQPSGGTVLVGSSTAVTGGGVFQVAGDVNISGTFKVNGVAFSGGTSLNGTGFVKVSGTTVSYDNSTYYLASNPSGYITSSALSSYLPLSGGTMTGILTFSATVGNKIDFYYSGDDRYGIQVQSSELRIHSGAQGTSTGGITFGKSTGSTFTEHLRIRNDGLIVATTNIALGSQQGYDNPGGWNKNILIDATNHGRFRIKASNYSYGNIDVQLWADSSVTPSHGISGSNSVFSFGGSITSLTVNGNTVIHSGNIGSQSVSYASTAGAASGATFLTQPNSTWGARIQLGGNGDPGAIANLAVVQATDGNLHMDNGTGKSMYLNYYRNGIIYLNGSTYSISANGSYYNGTAAAANSVSWGNVSSKPSHIMYYQSFTLDANTMDVNATGFTYSVNAPFTGPIARFSAGGSYDLWLGGSYGGSGNAFYLRTRNGDAGTHNPWRQIITDGNIGSQKVDGSLKLWAESHPSDYYVRANWTGSYWQLTSNHPSGVQVAYADSAGSAGSASTATTASRATRANGQFYIDDNYGNSVIGVYSSYRYQGVYSMGPAYVLPTDGTTPGNLYGMAWSHPNAGGQAGYLNDHGLLVMINGVTQSAISSNIWARGSITANSSIYGSDVYTTGGWFRNHTNSNGIYWSATGWHLMPADSADFRMHSGNSGAVALRMETSGTTRGYVYANSSNQIGFLSNSRSWIFRVYDTGRTDLGGDASGSIYVPRHLEARDAWGSCVTLFLGWSSGKTLLGNSASGGHDYAYNMGCNTVVSVNPFYCYQDITAYSDSRVKDNVKVVENSLEKIKSIRGVTFTRNDVDDKTKRHAGVIAQEVLSVLPEVVTEDARGHYSVAYGNLSALLIEAIKEQQTQIEELKSIINGLTK